MTLYRWGCRHGLSSLWRPEADTLWSDGSLAFLACIPDGEAIRGHIVGFSTTCSNLAFTLEMARHIRRIYPKKKIIMGGHGLLMFPHNPRLVPCDLADAICCGEGEHTLREVMDKGFENLEDVAGIFIPGENGWRATPERDLIRNLDEIPWPAYEEVRLEDYTNPYLALVGSRGCVNRCNYCFDRYASRSQYRTRSALHQVDELEDLSGRYRVEHFPYNDSVLNGNVRVLAAKTAEIVRRGLKVSYGGNLIVRDDMPEELFPALKQSGFNVALMGVESGSTQTLRCMSKRHTAESAARFVRLCHNAGIRTELNFMVGFPTETEEQFRETLDFIRTNRDCIDAVISAFTCHVMPSELWKRREEFGIVAEGPDAQRLWHTRDGANTYDVRRRRLNELLDLCVSLNLMSPATLCERTAESCDKDTLCCAAFAAFRDDIQTRAASGSPLGAETLASLDAWKKQRRNLAVRKTLERFGMWPLAKAAHDLFFRRRA